MISDVQKNFSNVLCYINDFCMMQVIGVLLGVNIQNVELGVGFLDDVEEVLIFFKLELFVECLWSVLILLVVVEILELVVKFMEVDIGDEEEKEREVWKVEVLKEKEVGNVQYKKKNFEVVVQYYSKVLEFDGEDILFIINCVVVYMEMGKVCVVKFVKCDLVNLYVIVMDVNVIEICYIYQELVVVVFGYVVEMLYVWWYFYEYLFKVVVDVGDVLRNVWVIVVFKICWYIV